MNAPTPHPLDDDAEFRFSHDAEVSRTPVYQPLLKWSSVVAAVSFAVVFLSAVASNNAPPNSSTEFMSIGVNRISSAVLLLACCGIMLAYRMPYMRAMTLDAKLVHGGLKGLGWMSSGYGTLIVCNLAGLAVVWGLLFLGPTLGPWVFLLIVLLGIVLAGLLVTMAVWHKNFLRAYAIGVLTVILLMFNSGMSAFLFSMPMARGAMQFNWPLGVAFSTAAVTGLICAAYVQMLTKYEKYVRQRSSTANERVADGLPSDD